MFSVCLELDGIGVALKANSKLSCALSPRQGVDMWGLTIQNESENLGPWEACVYTPSSQVRAGMSSRGTLLTNERYGSPDSIDHSHFECGFICEGPATYAESCFHASGTTATPCIVPGSSDIGFHPQTEASLPDFACVADAVHRHLLSLVLPSTLVVFKSQKEGS